MEALLSFSVARLTERQRPFALPRKMEATLVIRGISDFQIVRLGCYSNSRPQNIMSSSSAMRAEQPHKSSCYSQAMSRGVGTHLQVPAAVRKKPQPKPWGGFRMVQDRTCLGSQLVVFALHWRLAVVGMTSAARTDAFFDFDELEASKG